MISEPEARELLIYSCHSGKETEEQIFHELNSREFVDLLARIAIDEDDYQGDAPMQAAYFLSHAAPYLIAPHEKSLLQLVEVQNGYSGSVALALGRIKSIQAKPIIARYLKDGCWPEPLFREALSYYEET